MACACAGCMSILPASGPDRTDVQGMDKRDGAAPVNVALVDVTAAVAAHLQRSRSHGQFSQIGGGQATRYTVGSGDVLEVAIWEAPPAMLFVNAGISAGSAMTAPTPTRANELPPQMVAADGRVNIPYAGAVQAAGRTTAEIEAEIVRRLRGKANQPQALVRIASNASSQATVVGEVRNSARIPLTPKAERVLDALATAGGASQPVNKTTLQLTRGVNTYAMPLTAVIQDPRQNIPLQPGDVLTVLFQPLSFTALGAVGKSEEIAFEAGGISLAQALARTGGLLDNRADPAGVFVFRFEDAAVLGRASPAGDADEAKVPVVYRVDLRDPASLFAAQRFRVEDKDVLYVANAPAAELQKFLNVVLSGAYPVLNAINLTR
ncbi:polysaccharide biosynthesis/export family protein [Ralstonia sp. 25C]|uniref:polysaccharide biosynthesis/export family protein n=1 Tax=Ralstonia sp. 25C TaxID=3447363 RepID=UPI003F75611A